MTTAVKLDPRKLLSQLSDSDSSGCLEFEEGLVAWKIYLQQGKLKYVYCSVQLLDQLLYYLYYLGWKQAVAAIKKLPSSDVKLQFYVPEKSSEQNLYSKVICWLLAEKYLDRAQSFELIEQITKDALNSFLWNDRGTFLWHDEHPLPLWIKVKFGDIPSLSVSECLELEQTRLKQWHNCNAQLLSVHQRPYLNTNWAQKPLPTSGLLTHQALKELAKVMRGKTSIRQISLLLQKDELFVAKILSPYIEDKIVYLRHAQSPLDKLPCIPRPTEDIQQLQSVTPPPEGKSESDNPEIAALKTWKIVCIDDSPTILQEIQRFLGTERFEVTAIDDPVQAVSILFRVKPDLILLDITMPKINGYKLCGLLRGSGYCDQTPIIMVTANTGFIDKARAKLAGATDYLTKPFTKEGLMEIIAKYLP